MNPDRWDRFCLRHLVRFFFFLSLSLFYKKVFWNNTKFGPGQLIGTTSVPSNSGCIQTDALIRLVSILIALKAWADLCLHFVSSFVPLTVTCCLH